MNFGAFRALAILTGFLSTCRRLLPCPDVPEAFALPGCTGGFRPARMCRRWPARMYRRLFALPGCAGLSVRVPARWSSISMCRGWLQSHVRLCSVLGLRVLSRAWQLQRTWCVSLRSPPMVCSLGGIVSTNYIVDPTRGRATPYSLDRNLRFVLGDDAGSAATDSGNPDFHWPSTCLSALCVLWGSSWVWSRMHSLFWRPLSKMLRPRWLTLTTRVMHRGQAWELPSTSEIDWGPLAAVFGLWLGSHHRIYILIKLTLPWRPHSVLWRWEVPGMSIFAAVPKE